MDAYCVNRNAQSSGEREVHNISTNCSFLPAPENRVDLGQHSSCESAITAAQAIYDLVDGCAYCAADCHTG